MNDLIDLISDINDALGKPTNDGIEKYITKKKKKKKLYDKIIQVYYQTRHEDVNPEVKNGTSSEDTETKETETIQKESA